MILGERIVVSLSFKWHTLTMETMKVLEAPSKKPLSWVCLKLKTKWKLYWEICRKQSTFKLQKIEKVTFMRFLSPHDSTDFPSRPFEQCSLFDVGDFIAQFYGDFF